MKTKLLLLATILLALLTRFYGLNWDQGQHLHPDERFLTMVGNAMTMPQSFAQYLDPTSSPMNPANIGHTFYVYGTFPVVLNKLLAIPLGYDNYSGFTLQGRALSALADILIVVFIYKLVFLLEKHYKLDSRIKFFAALSYTAAVLPIQLAHFFAVDTFLSLFLFASLYFALKYYFEGKTYTILLCALVFGLALSSKISGVLFLPLLLYFIAIGTVTTHKRHQVLGLLPHRPSRSEMIKLSGLFVCFGLIVYSIVRLANPYMFQHANPFNPQISEAFITNLKTLKSWEGNETWFPPAIQWIDKTPILFAASNIAVFGLGIPATLFFLIGSWGVAKKYRYPALIVPLLWALLFFVYQSAQFVQSVRYFIILYPLLAIVCGIGLTLLSRQIHTYGVIPLLVLLFFWPAAFMSIYTKPHSRVEASQWMYAQLPNNSMIISEYWDDPLPIGVADTQGKVFTGEQIAVFDPESDEKWQKIDDILNRGDYYVLSSNRAWGSIPTVPWKYPITTRFYEKLFAERRGYTKVAEFTSYPSLRYLGIPIDFPDDWADESFTVYDHPKVLIFQKDTPTPSPADF